MISFFFIPVKLGTKNEAGTMIFLTFDACSTDIYQLIKAKNINLFYLPTTRLLRPISGYFHHQLQ